MLTTAHIDQKKGVRFSLNIKHIDDKNLEKNCLWIIYADTFAFIDFTTETGYVITDQKLAKFQAGVFKVFYDRT